MASGGEIAAICLLFPLLVLLFILLIEASNAREKRERERLLNRPKHPKVIALQKLKDLERRRAEVTSYAAVIAGVKDESQHEDLQEVAQSALHLLDHIQASYEEELLEAETLDLQEDLTRLRGILTGAEQGDTKGTLELVKAAKATCEGVLTKALVREVEVPEGLRESYLSEDGFRTYVVRKQKRSSRPLELKSYVRLVSPRYHKIKDSLTRVADALARCEQSVAALALLETVSEATVQRGKDVDLAPHQVLLELETFLALAEQRVESKMQMERGLEKRKAQLQLQLEDIQAASRRGRIGL